MSLLIAGTIINLLMFLCSIAIILVGNRELAISTQLMAEARDERVTTFAALVELRNSKE